MLQQRFCRSCGQINLNLLQMYRRKSSEISTNVKERPVAAGTDPSLVRPAPQYTDREAVPRSDAHYDMVNPLAYIKHRETLDPRRYSVEVQSLEANSLRPEISPEGERYVSRLVLSAKGSCYATLRSYVIYMHFAAECLEIETEVESGKLKTGVYTINRSPHVHGAHKDRFKRDVWNRKLILHDISGTTADVFRSYVERNIPAGVTLAVTEERLAPLPLEFLESFYQQTNSAIQDEIASLGPGEVHETAPS